MTSVRIEPPSPTAQSPYRRSPEERREEKEAPEHPVFAEILGNALRMPPLTRQEVRP